MNLGAAGVVALVHFYKHLSADSATWRAQSGYKEISEWSSTFKTNMLLADIVDSIAWFNYSFASAYSKRKPKKPTTYPRPWVSTGQTLGKEPIPVKDFWNWWNKQ